VTFHFQAHARHAQRLAHSVRVVDHVRLREHVDDLAVLRYVDGAGRVDGAVDVELAHLPLLAGDGDHAAAVHGPDVAARDAGVHARDLGARHLLGFRNRQLDRFHRGVDIHHHAAPQPARRRRAHAHHVETARARLGDHGADLRGADVEADHVLRALAALHRGCPLRRIT
jgi:hypothetical protein